MCNSGWYFEIIYYCNNILVILMDDVYRSKTSIIPYLSNSKDLNKILEDVHTVSYRSRSRDS